jgi:hypothetical protein
MDSEVVTEVFVLIEKVLNFSTHYNQSFRQQSNDNSQYDRFPPPSRPVSNIYTAAPTRGMM